MTALNQEQVRALENIRTRLLTLRSSLSKLQENIGTAAPLPSASTLQVSASVVSNSLQSISEQLAEHQHLLSSIAVFPLPQFPGRYQGHILTDTLLRTKLEPKIEEWMEQGQTLAEPKPDAGWLSGNDRSKLWKWAPGAANREARKQKWGADYTLAEVRGGVENVVTGLKRQLIEPDDDDEEYNEGDDDGYEEVTDEEDEGPDKMDTEPSSTAAGGSSAISPTGTAVPTIAGKPAYLETLQEFLTVGRVQRYSPSAVEDRAESERKGQRTAPIG